MGKRTILRNLELLLRMDVLHDGRYVPPSCCCNLISYRFRGRGARFWESLVWDYVSVK